MWFSMTAAISPLTALLPIAARPSPGGMVYAREAQVQGRPLSAPGTAASPARARKSVAWSRGESQVTRKKPATDPSLPGRIGTLSRREAAIRAAEVNTPWLFEGGRAASDCGVDHPVVHVERDRFRSGGTRQRARLASPARRSRRRERRVSTRKT
jgi:hypothetical protein